MPALATTGGCRQLAAAAAAGAEFWPLAGPENRYVGVVECIMCRSSRTYGPGPQISIEGIREHRQQTLL